MTADIDWSTVRVLVAGFDAIGSAVTDALVQLGNEPLAIDESTEHDEHARVLRILGADIRLGPGATDIDPAGQVDLIIASPVWADNHPVLAAARRAGIEIFSDVELAWRLRVPESPPWLVIAGGTGVEETADMITAILATAGQRARAVGTGGVPIIQAVMDPEPCDVLVAGLSAQQLQRTRSMVPRAAAVLNAGTDAAPLGQAYENAEIACIYNVEDRATERLVEDADVQEGCRAIGFTLGTPARSMIGVVDDVIADRAFIVDRANQALELARINDAPAGPAALPHALAAAALARAHGVPASAVAAGLRGFTDDTPPRSS